MAIGHIVCRAFGRKLLNLLQPIAVNTIILASIIVQIGFEGARTLIKHLPIPKPGHTTGRSGRSGGWWGGGAGRGVAVGTPTERFAQEPWCFPGFPSIEDICFHNCFFSKTSKQILCKPMGEENVRWTTGLSAVYPRDEGCSSSLAADQCKDAYLSL